MVSNKHVFWQALLSAILIFGVGIFLGIAFEEARNHSVENSLLVSEINVLDNQVAGQLGTDLSLSCDTIKNNIIKIADKIYDEARVLEEYDYASQLTTALETMHKRYDLLRVMLWTQSINYEKKCGDGFHIVVYLYQYKDPEPQIRSEQIVFSRILEGLKDKYGNDFVLIPIAGDLKLESVELIKEKYNLKSYPAVIIDGKIIDSTAELSKIEEDLFSSKQ
ncbi:hypothetical protein J4408_00925 [Candidatus Pacearchaeota archaeon]|nr:hypothetical protein [Candidatus Pacearchaeota archaeon]